ncbi:polysaccharide deacetylase family protein [Luteimonas saliphila]|uniref:polysaccharide deacetylase family protein n=1 Tax=Luteimonas saliphila TaxID=2804919 RepID=UPI00192D88F4|nr:polysaccharide deacetylase family protein [Luteimonas saliphila]
MLPLLRTVRGLFRRDLRVLAYHRVRDVAREFAFDRALVSASPARFHSQMRHLRDRFHPVSCREVVAALDGGPALPRDAVLVTFDDGYDDNHAVAFPILRELGVPATFFVATGHIDSGMPYAYDWVAHLVVTMSDARLRLPELAIDVPLPADRDARHALTGTVLDRLKYLDDAGQQGVIDELQARCGRPRAAGHVDCRPMTWDQLREMRDGGMEIGGHGVHHRMLAKLPDEALLAEVSECQARLTAELGAPAIAVSYPVGGPDAYDARVIDAVRAQGFRIGFSYINGVSVPDDANRYGLLRVAVEADVDQSWFQGILAAPELFSHATKLRVYPS